MNRFRVRGDGSLLIIDPRPSDAGLIATFDPTFAIRTTPLPGFEGPRLNRTRVVGCGVPRDDLPTTDAAALAGHLAWRRGEPAAVGEATALELRVELATRMLARCELCGLRCGVNRLAGQVGRCGLGSDAVVYEAYTHIAEEAPINPALNISLRGCGMRCRYCQQFSALQPLGAAADRLNSTWWGRLDLTLARSLSFIGGNPTENLPGILHLLSAAPSDFALPIVWNCSGYDSSDAIRLLDGVVDCFVPDCKYGNDACAEAWSASPRYLSTMSDALVAMLEQAVPVYVRILVLPGHVECCHLPTLDWLAPYRDQLMVHVMSQYQPMFRISSSDGEMNRAADPRETAFVASYASELGLHLL